MTLCAWVYMPLCNASVLGLSTYNHIFLPTSQGNEYLNMKTHTYTLMQGLGYQQLWSILSFEATAQQTMPLGSLRIFQLEHMPPWCKTDRFLQQCMHLFKVPWLYLTLVTWRTQRPLRFSSLRQRQSAKRGFLKNSNHMTSNCVGHGKIPICQHRNALV